MYEILVILAAIANIGSFILGLLQEYKHSKTNSKGRK